jgi:hypothetical protein
MNYRIAVASLVIASLATGFVVGVNSHYSGQDGERDVFSKEMSILVNESNRNAEVTFENSSIGVWYQEGEFFLDMDGDDSFESELSETEKENQGFIREVVRDQKAYQLYFQYNNGTEQSSASLEVYRVRRI